MTQLSLRNVHNSTLIIIHVIITLIHKSRRVRIVQKRNKFVHRPNSSPIVILNSPNSYLTPGGPGLLFFELGILCDDI